MTFPWYEPKRRLPTSADAARRDEVLRQELEDRAALLFRLGYAKPRAKARLKANVQWDYELRGKPRHEKDIDKIVDAVYRRGGGSGPPTV
jgi:hypothetical protein